MIPFVKIWTSYILFEPLLVVLQTENPSYTYNLKNQIIEEIFRRRICLENPSFQLTVNVLAIFKKKARRLNKKETSLQFFCDILKCLVVLIFIEHNR